MSEEASYADLYIAERRAIKSGRPVSQELAELRNKPNPPEFGLFAPKQAEKVDD